MILTGHNHSRAGVDPPPLIAHISSFGGTSYSFNTAYGVGKAAVDRLAKDMALELRREGANVRCCSVYPVSCFSLSNDLTLSFPWGNNAGR